MQGTVLQDRQLLPSLLRELLPPRLFRAVQEAMPQGELVEEIRLRRGHAASLTASGRNRRLSLVLSGVEMDELLLRLCQGSLYAHGETLCAGYLTLQGGIRVGVCGRAGVSEGRVTGISEVSGISIRIPHTPPPMGGEIASLLRQMSLTRGVLVYAPPAVGKTTLLRCVAALMAGGEEPLRVAVVDTRGELAFSLDSPSLLIDLLSGYPKGRGISIAARTLSAQLIVCDEIGDVDEAREILRSHHCGVPLLASAHAAGIRELLLRPGMHLLHEAGCFGAYVQIARRPDAFDFDYHILDWEGANALL